MPERKRPDLQNNRKVNANALTLEDFYRIEQAAGLSLGTDLSGNHPSPLLQRPGCEIICKEKTIGAIRPRTTFRIEGQRATIIWENPGVEFLDSGVRFTNFDPLSLGETIIVTRDSVQIKILEERI